VKTDVRRAERIGWQRNDVARLCLPDKDSPQPRPVCPLGEGCVTAITQVGGLHHRYERLAA